MYILFTGGTPQNGNVTPNARTTMSPARIASSPFGTDMSSPLNYGTPSSLSTPRSLMRGTPSRQRPDLRTNHVGASVPAPSSVRF